MTEGAKISKITLPERLTKPSEFRRITKNGSRKRHDFLTIYVSPASNPGRRGGKGRIGFIITSRAVKSAVKRNRVRRLLREAVRKWWMHLQQGYDIVLKAGSLPKTDHASYVETTFVKICAKAAIFTPDGTTEAKKFLSGTGDFK